MQSGTTNTLLEVWGLDATHVYATGAGGAMLRFDGTQWSSMPNDAGTDRDLGTCGAGRRRISSPSGQNGALLRWDGTTWTAMTTPVTIALFGVWGAAPNDVYAVGVEGTLLHYDGSDVAVRRQPDAQAPVRHLGQRA